MQIGRNLSKARKELELEQEDLAKEVGVTGQHISKIETEGGLPSLKVLLALSKALGVSTDYLLTGRKTAPFDATGAIRAERDITAAAKRHLIGLLKELRTKT
jgi:transcriptional regulator with XRE-family HTH domain